MYLPIDETFNIVSNTKCQFQGVAASLIQKIDPPFILSKIIMSRLKKIMTKQSVSPI